MSASLGAVLAEARRILKPGGLLAVQVPNDLDAYRAWLSRPDNRWWVIPPLHLFYFTEPTLRRWLESFEWMCSPWQAKATSATTL